MKLRQTIFLVSHVGGCFNVYDSFIPTKAFKFREDALKFINSQSDPSRWQIDTIVLE